MTQSRVGEVVVFDREGRFLRAIGTEGSGPGEYSSGYRRVIATNGDSIHIFDVPSARHTVLSPDYDVIRSIPLSTQVDPLDRWMERARWVVSVDANAPADRGWRLRVIDDSGKAIKRLGASPPDPEEQILVRAVSRVSNGRIWTGGGGRYLVELWDSAGQRQRAFSRDVGWFPAIDVTDPKWLTQYWPGTVIALQEDTEGRLWVVTVVAEEAPADARPPGSPNVPAAKRAGVIEVIDIRTGRLLATTRLPWVPDRFLDDLTLSTYRADQRTGQPYVDVWRLRLEK